MSSPRVVREIDRSRLVSLMQQEQRFFDGMHAKSREIAKSAIDCLPGAVPMSWMTQWPGGAPIYFAEANGASITDVDGNRYVDFCLGDTGAMAGHSPKATVDAVIRRIQTLGGITTMLPSEDAVWVGQELGRRFGLPFWEFTLSATDANRFALRSCRKISGRPKIAVFNWCYHGTVDESFVMSRDGVTRSRPGNIGAAIDPTFTSYACEFNDIESVERALTAGDVAALLMEPALTNIGIVLPDPGFLEAVREVTRTTGTLLIIDETHTWSAGPGGCTEAWKLEPDLVTVGKSFAGGVPIGAYGMTAEIAAKVQQFGLQPADATNPDANLPHVSDTSGLGGTLAGNPLSLAAARATLSEVLTEEAFVQMNQRREQFVAGVEAGISRWAAPFSIASLGARCEYAFAPELPRTGTSSADAHDNLLDQFMHLWMLNRGILITPFHNMALMCPETTAADVDLHTRHFDGVCEALFG